ncbi:MAG: MlaD family protein, partial [Pseudomonadota bacterium]
VGAPVEFRGVFVGEVKNIDVQFNRERREFAMLVEIDFYPERLFRNRARTAPLPPNGTPSLARLVERGLRAQLRTANLLTGQLYVALDFHPGKTRVSMDTTLKPPQIPTLPGSSQELQATITSIARKLESLPIQEIGADLRRTLQSAATVLQRVDKEIAPEARDTLVETRKAMADARVAVNDARKAITAVERAAASAERTITAVEPLPLEASDAMREIARAAEAFRVLADYLERHPEALIRGKRQ